MMRSLWTIITTVALANLIAIVAFVAWLGVSDRLDLDRLERVRETLAETRTAEEARLEEERLEQERADAEREAALREAMPPLTAGDRLLLTSESAEATRQRLERMRREIEDLQRTIRAEADTLDSRTAAFEEERDAFNAMRDAIAAREGDEQFRKTVTLLEGLPAARASEMLLQLVELGDADQAIAYLDALQARTASKILAAVDDATVAADLLERLRVYGLEARAD